LSERSLGSVVVAIKAVDEASGVMDKIRASVGVLGSSLGQLGGGFAAVGNVLTGFAAGGVAGAAMAGIGQVVQGLQASVAAAAESQQAWTDLQASLKLTGPEWDTARTAIDSFASSLQKSTVYEDEAIVGAVQKLSTFGMSYQQAMDAVKVSVDLAAAKHMDLESAVNLVGKAFMGNTAAFTRYGVDITTAKDASSAAKDAIGSLADALNAMGPDLGVVSEYLTSAGVAITNSEGNFRSFKDVATDLVGALQEGKISAEDFASVQSLLGTNIDAAKLKASDFTGILSQLNDQFGGQATAQAQTYAGAQERLKNAVSDVSEKIGMVLLPVLASVTEGMIPVVDAFGKGVDAVSAWLGEIAKTPEGQAAIQALNDAFAGLTNWFAKFAADVGATFGPALSELWDALKELGTALSPLVEAFGELFSAFGAGTGEGSGLKDVLQLIVIPIRALAEVIKLVAPGIREMADAFKAAADFIAPIIETIRNAVTGFIDAMKAAFQGFYTFLIGGSLWTDLWNGMVSIVQSTGELIGTVISGLFTVWSGLFTVGLGLLQMTITTGFQLVMTMLQGVVQTGTAALMAIFQPFLDLISSGAKSWNDLSVSVNTNVGLMKGQLKGFFDWLTPFWESSTAAFLGTATIWLETLNGQMRTRLNDMHSVWSSTLSSMAGDAASYFNSIVAQISAAVDRIIAKLSAARAQVSSHSIWPDMLNEMLTQTEDYMGQIEGAFAEGLQGGIVPTIAATGQQAPSAGFEEKTPLTPVTTTHDITLPIQIILDGEVLYTMIEKRQVQTIMQAARSKRG
jgi:uncharacterized protein YukE